MSTARALKWLVLGVVPLACVTSWRFQRVEGELPSIHDDLWNEVNCAGLELHSPKAPPACRAASAPLVHCERDPALCRSAPNARGVPTVDEATCRGLKPVLSFVHLSDARLREHRLLVSEDDGDEQLSTALDALQRNDDAVLLATVLAANQLGGLPAGALGTCPAPAKPRFAIHTGDAVGAGLFSELLQFVAAMDQLDYPWLNVVGNNDVHFFGGAPNEAVEGLNVVLPYVPIVDVDRFMRFHSRKGLAQDPALPAPKHRGVDHEPSQTQFAEQVTSFHGFDLPCAGEADRNRLCPRARGYYALELPFDEAPAGARKLRVVVLNTAEDVADLGERTSGRGQVLPEQLRWLERQLAGAGPDTYVLVFGHHPLDDFRAPQGDELLALLQASPRVLGYFGGHTRVDAYTVHPRAAGLPLWEFTAGSTFAFPQLARQVELLAGPDGALYLRLLSFRQQLSDARGLDPGPSAAAGPRGECRALGQGTNFCYRLAQRSRRARDGAEGSVAPEDRVSEAQAIQNANGLVLVYQPAEGTPDAQQR